MRGNTDAMVEDEREQMLQTIRDLEFVVFASRNRGYLNGDIQMVEASGKALHKAHQILGLTHARDEPRRVFDTPTN